MHVELIPIKTEVKYGQFDLLETIIKSMKQNDEEMEEGDIIAISSKFVAMSQGATVQLNTVKPGKRAQILAERFAMDPRLAELVLQESDYVFGGIEGFLLAVKDGVIAPNAGIDKSNVKEGFVILHPREPFKSAQDLNRRLREKTGKKIGTVLVDSRLMPTRMGTVGVAIAVAGFQPVEDLRGKEDLFGNVLRVTRKATADSIATAANMVMGESKEAIPIVILRNCNVIMSDTLFSWRDLAIPYDQCIYVRGLGTRDRATDRLQFR
ncbi:MAG: coenzyme F420-0:L-glutamate ligase [Nitrososphaerales archaeon]